MKQSHDSSDDYKLPVTANETISYFYVVTVNAHDQVQIPTNSDETIIIIITFFS